MASETWFPAPSAPEGKIVCRRKTEICSVKKIMAGGRVLAGQAGRKCSGGREASFACIKRRRAAKSCCRAARFRIPAAGCCIECR